MNYRKPKYQKLSLNQALDTYYAQQVQKGEIEATGPQRMEITAKPFASYVMFLGVVEHWGKILRKLTGKTVFITASYYDYDKVTVKHETKEYLSKADFLKSLAST